MENTNKYCEKCDKWLDNNGDNDYKCHECHAETRWRHPNPFSFCACGKLITETNREAWEQQKPNFKKRVTIPHEFDENKGIIVKVTHECHVKCANCEKTKPITDYLIAQRVYGPDLSLANWCDSCSWHDIEGLKEKDLERLKNSPNAQDQRDYQKYLKLKAKYGNDDNHREREREKNFSTTNWDTAIRNDI